MSELETLLDSLVGEDEWARHQTLGRLRERGATGGEIGALAAQLAGDDASRRAGARMALATLASPGSPAAEEAGARLVDALRSDDGDLRILAASAMGEAGNAELVEPLLGRLTDDDPNVVAAVADALGTLGPPSALEPLMGLLDHSSAWVRTAAVVALGRLRDPAALPALRRLVEEPAQAGPLIEAVHRIDAAESLPLLQQLHEAAPEPALVAAAGVLSAHPELDAPEWIREGARARESALRDTLRREDDAARSRLLGLSASDEALVFLIRLAGPPRRSEAALNGLLAAPPRRRAAAILRQLEGIEPQDQATLLSLLPPLETDEVDRLVPLLGSADPRVRAAAADALARSPAERALPILSIELGRPRVAPELVRAAGALGTAACVALVPLLRDDDPAVRAAAADALGRCGDREVPASIRDALRREENPETRRALLRALGRAAGEDAVSALSVALEDPDPATRVVAIEALGFTGSEAAVRPLRAALDGSAAERHAALRALGDIGGRDAAALIETFLSSPDLDLRRAAARAALSVARELDPERVADITADPDPLIRAWSVRLVDARGGPREALHRLAAGDPDPEVRALARRAANEP